MSHSDSETNQQRWQHGTGVVVLINSSGVHHQHQQHSHQQLHEEAPSLRGEGRDSINTK